MKDLCGKYYHVLPRIPFRNERLMAPTAGSAVSCQPLSVSSLWGLL